jgi:dienelactone hydrolase
MNRCFLGAGFGFLLLAALEPSWAEEQPSKAIAARVELHPVQTLTLTDQQFLTGANEGTATTIGGQLRIPPSSGRVPVVVLQHGSGGFGANVDMWTREFNERGIATFALDGFTGRGLTQVSSDQALLGRLNFVLDIYRALNVLAKHPRVDTARIALMGFSRGGQAALYASLKRFHQTWNKSGVEFAAYVPFYPDCMTTFISDAETAERPIRIFHGAADDFNPIAACKSYVERLRTAGRDVAITEYPNAAHSFDNPLGAQPAAIAPNSQTVRNCNIREERNGQLVNAKTGEAFTYKDSCVQRGPHLGHDPAATKAAKQAVTEFLQTVFKIQ